MRREHLAEGEWIDTRTQRAALLVRRSQAADLDGRPRAALVEAVFDEWLEHLSGHAAAPAGRSRRARLLEDYESRASSASNPG